MFTMNLQLFADDEVIPQSDSPDLPTGDDDLQQPDTGEQEPSQEPEPAPVTFTQEQVNQLIEKRLSRERKAIEKTGLNPNEFERLAKSYGVSSQYLVRHILNQLEEGVGQQAQQSQQPLYDPRVDVLLKEKEESSVRKLWKSDFGADPTDEELDSIKDLQDQYAAKGRSISLEDAYQIATRNILKEKLSKQMEAKIMNDLKMKQKGKVVGTAPTVNATPKFGSVKDALNAAADKIEWK